MTTTWFIRRACPTAGRLAQAKAAEGRPTPNYKRIMLDIQEGI